MSQNLIPPERRLRPLDFVWIVIGVGGVIGGLFVLPGMFSV